VRSVNGRDKTTVNGNYPTYTNRCFFITANAVIDGLTIFNGFVVTNSSSGAVGGGVLMGINTCAGGGGTIQNCTIIGNTASNPSTSYAGGGGVFIFGIGYIYNSIICSNSIDSARDDWYVGGGGVCSVWPYGAVVSNCIVFTNKIYRSTTMTVTTQPGGGLFIAGGTVVNCTVYSNFSQGRGGGIWCEGGYLRNSSSYKNYSLDAGAGIETSSATSENCLVYGNIGPSGARIDNASFTRNCTIVGNSGQGIQTYATAVGLRYENTVVYYNGGVDISRSGGGDPIFTNCCAGPASATVLTNGIGNITNAPLFVNTNISNYRLANNSPCVNRGTNRSWMTNSSDLDGRARIRYGVVDMGAYERIHEATFYRFH
jgi:hypothetical protein